MSILRCILGRDPLTPEQQATQDRFRREEAAATFWEDNHDPAGVSMNNVAHVGNHELWLSTLAKYNVTRQGMINGYVRAYNRIPYWLSDNDYIGE